MSEPAISPETLLQLAGDVTFQSLGEGMETVILSLDTGTLYTCNQTTEAFLRLLGTARSFGEAVDLLLAEYDVGREILESDLREVAQELLAEGLIRRTV